MLYVFDCDGVLVDSEIIASQVDAEHLTRLGYAITAEEVTIRFAGLTARELGAIVEVEIGHPLPPNFFDEQKSEIDRRLSANLEDRKSTRLNSSHVEISYAVFCL